MPALVAVFANIVAKLDQDGNFNRNYQIASAALGVCIGLTVVRIVIIIVMNTRRSSKTSFKPLQEEKTALSSSFYA